MQKHSVHQTDKMSDSEGFGTNTNGHLLKSLSQTGSTRKNNILILLDLISKLKWE